MTQPNHQQPSRQLQGDHIVLKCQGDDCGMRYPSPADDPRRNACPLCEAPVQQVGVFTDPPQQPEPDLSTGRDGSALVGVLDNIRSALNVGAMMRSADGAAIDHLYLGGLTAPADNPKVRKSALGAEISVPCTSHLDVLPAVQSLQADGYQIWAVDFTTDSVAIQQLSARPERLAFIVGNERSGVDPALLALADRHVHLDMHGTKTTLNVGVAFGVVAHWLRTLAVA